MAQSLRYRIARVVWDVVKTAAQPLGARVLWNPRLPIDPAGMPTRVAFVLDRGDRLVEQPGQQQRRQSRVVVGAMSTTGSAAEGPDAAADEVYSAVHAAMRSFVATARGAGLVVRCREAEVDPDVREIATDAALVLAAFEIEYQEKFTGG